MDFQPPSCFHLNIYAARTGEITKLFSGKGPREGISIEFYDSSVYNNTLEVVLLHFKK